MKVSETLNFENATFYPKEKHSIDEKAVADILKTNNLERTLNCIIQLKS